MRNKLVKIKLNKQRVCVVGARCSLVLLIVSLTLQVVITNEYATRGNEMVVLQEKEHVLKRDLSFLKLKLSEASSLTHIEQKAYKLGFQEYDEPIAVIGSSQFAVISDY